MHRGPARLLALASIVAAAACSRGARSPEAAFTMFTKAVTTGDGRLLFRALDQKTRWSWMTVLRCHREAYDIVLSTYPPGASRDRELARTTAAAQADDVATLFAQEAAPAALSYLRALAVPSPRVETNGDTATVVLASGARVPLRRGDDGSWGFAGLADDAADRERRAIHDLEIVKTSAADFERAAARAPR